MKTRKKLLVTSIAMAIAMPVTTAEAATIYQLSWTGAITFLESDGTIVPNPDTPSVEPWHTYRTPITGTLEFDDIGGLGIGDTVDAVVQPFSYFGKDLLSFAPIEFAFSAADGSVVTAGYQFSWDGKSHSGVFGMNGSGLFNDFHAGLTTTQVVTGGVLPATDDRSFEVVVPGATFTIPIPLGPSPLATTSFNTIMSPSLTGWTPQFDITSMHVTAIISPIPVPAAVWLFGSGLIGLIGMARRKQPGTERSFY